MVKSLPIKYLEESNSAKIYKINIKIVKYLTIIANVNFVFLNIFLYIILLTSYNKMTHQSSIDLFP